MLEGQRVGVGIVTDVGLDTATDGGGARKGDYQNPQQLYDGPECGG